MSTPTGLFLLSADAYAAVYEPHAAKEIAGSINIIAPPQTAHTIHENLDLLQSIDFIFSGWGMPKVTSEFLTAAPNLKVIFYGAGSVNAWATPAMWQRGIAVTTANQANAVPAAEFTLATILFSLKHGFRLAKDQTTTRGFMIRPEVPGCYRSVVGLIGMGTVARLVVSLLRPFEVSVVAYDPYLTDSDARQLGVSKVSLAELFSVSDAVSLHAPDVPQTRGMITGEHITSMKPGATFINTARGNIVREDEMIIALRNRLDLQAVLDVTQREPLPTSSPLNDLPNVTITPHIAGSQGRECQRMGQYMVDELQRYLAGVPLLWQVKPSELEHSVHQLAVA